MITTLVLLMANGASDTRILVSLGIRRMKLLRRVARYASIFERLAAVVTSRA